MGGTLSSPPISAARGSTWFEFDVVPAWDPDRRPRAGQVPGFISGAALGFRLIGGRWVCSGVVLSVDGELTTGRWRSVPLGLLIDQALGGTKLVESKPPSLPTSRPQRGSRGPDMDFYRDVGKLYRQAIQREPRRPVAWMAEQLEVDGPDPIEQTRRWIRMARRYGFLRGSIAGKPGETPKQKVKVKR